MPTWLLPILIGGTIMGLIGIIYHNVTDRIRHLERWKDGRATAEEVLTKSTHAELCHERGKELIQFMDKRHEEMKDFIGDKIKILELGIRKLNGEKE